MNQPPSSWAFYFDNRQCDTQMEILLEPFFPYCNKSKHVFSPHTHRRMHLLFPPTRRSPRGEKMMIALELFMLGSISVK